MKKLMIGMLTVALAAVVAPAQAQDEASPEAAAAAFMASVNEDMLKLKAEIEAAGTAAAEAKDPKARATEWKKVTVAEQKFFKLLKEGKNGMKLPKDKAEAAKQMYYQQAVARIEQDEGKLTDPLAKKFFAEKKAKYAAKIAKPKAAKAAKKGAKSSKE